MFIYFRDLLYISVCRNNNEKRLPLFNFKGVIMVKSEVLKLLNTKTGSFQHAINAVSRYVKSPNILPRVVNRIVLKAQKQKNITSMDLFKYFYEEMGGLVKGTKLCPNTYTAQMFLKSVWETLQLQALVVSQIRKNYAIMDELEDIEVVEDTPKKTTKKTTKKKETPEERKERLRRQAEKMRQAKAQKNQQKEKKVEQKSEVESQTHEQPKTQHKELTPEQREQLDILKRLKL